MMRRFSSRNKYVPLGQKKDEDLTTILQRLDRLEGTVTLLQGFIVKLFGPNFEEYCRANKEGVDDDEEDVGIIAPSCQGEESDDDEEEEEMDQDFLHPSVKIEREEENHDVEDSDDDDNGNDLILSEVLLPATDPTPRILQLQPPFFKIVWADREEEGSNWKVKAACLNCPTSKSKVIKGSNAVTSNFVTHLKRVHPGIHKSYKQEGRPPGTRKRGRKARIIDPSSQQGSADDVLAPQNSDTLDTTLH